MNTVYYKNRKQYIEQKNNLKMKKRVSMQINFWLPQVSILGQLPFLVYINDLAPVSKYLTPIMFAADTNQFCSHNNVKILTENANNELKRFHRCLSLTNFP